jgi:hypothetical protein
MIIPCETTQGDEKRMPYMIEKNEIDNKLEQIFNPQHTLVRNDIIWVLESIKKKVAEEDPKLLALSQPRLLKNFHHFAEIAMTLIHQKSFFDQELDRFKSWAYEASYGLNSTDKVT